MGKSMGSATDGMRILKWPSKQRDNAARVRNNQRRHRENARNYVKNLEARLAESQLKLQEALNTIERLKMEMSPAQQSSSEKLESSRCPSACSGRSYTIGETSHRNDEEQKMQPALISGHSPEDSQSQWRQSSGNPVLSEAAAVSLCFAYDETLEDEVDHSTRSPGKENCTTLCREAYMIISQQNYAGIEESVIYQWLEPGFRGPSSTQAGCRVDNQTLFRLLDYISSSKCT